MQTIPVTASFADIARHIDHDGQLPAGLDTARLVTIANAIESADTSDSIQDDMADIIECLAEMVGDAITAELETLIAQHTEYLESEDNLSNYWDCLIHEFAERSTKRALENMLLDAELLAYGEDGINADEWEHIGDMLAADLLGGRLAARHGIASQDDALITLNNSGEEYLPLSDELDAKVCQLAELLEKTGELTDRIKTDINAYIGPMLLDKSHNIGVDSEYCIAMDRPDIIAYIPDLEAIMLELRDYRETNKSEE